MTNNTNTTSASGADDLRAAAQAVIDRWDTPLWKDAPATAEYINRLRAALAASAQPVPAAILAAAAPAQAGEYPADTGTPEADRIIGRLTSSDPDFDDCTDAAALIRKMVAEHKGPDGFATWKDAAVAERVRRVEVVPMPLPRHRYCLNSSPVMPGYTADEMIAYRSARGAAQVAPSEELAKRLIGDVEVADSIATATCQRVADLDDRDSPNYWPEAMLVTGAELHMIVREAAIAAQAALVEAAVQPDRTGIYAWVSGSSTAMVLVNKRPSNHAPGGQWNGHVIDSTRFYDGCPITHWGRDGRWTLLYDFDAARAAQGDDKP